MISYEEKLRKECPAIFRLGEGMGDTAPQPSMSYGDGLMQAFMKAAGGDKKKASQAMIHLINTPELLQRIIGMAGNSIMGGQGEVTGSATPSAGVQGPPANSRLGPNPFGNK
jgi:hypothetical protein